MATFNTRLSLLRTRLEETTANVHDDDLILDDYNHACRDVVAKTDPRQFIVEYDFNAATSTRGYALPSDYREVLALYRGASNRKMYREYLDEVQGVSLTDTGTPRYYTIVNGTVYLRPVPSTAASMHLKYRKWPTAMTGTSSTVPVPDYMFAACEAYVMARQMEQIGDFDTASINWEIYDREIADLISQQSSERGRDHARVDRDAW